MKAITVVFDKDGNPTVRASGVSGPACTAFTSGLIDKLGQVTSTVPTEEYLQTQNTQATEFSMVKAR